jgi:trypsin-like peptidase
VSRSPDPRTGRLRDDLASSRWRGLRALRVSIVALAIPSVCLGQSARDIARTAFKSVVLLEMNDAHGQPLSLGSGFFIADGIIATNAHVIEGAASGTAKLVGNDHKYQILGTIALDRHTDLALLKVESDAPALHLEPEVTPAVGDKVYVVGNPLGLEGTFSEGIISGIRPVGSDSILQMTAPISPGSSGGPVMDASGTVIGVAEATFGEGQNMNLAVPVAYLSKLWTGASPHPFVTPLSQESSPDAVHKSVVDGIGTRIEAGISTSDFTFTYFDAIFGTTLGYELRITNQLPVAASNIRLRIIYHDGSNAIMDFEDLTYSQTIPPGLTKTVTTRNSEEAKRAKDYYDTRVKDGSLRPPPTSDNSYNAFAEKMEPRVEIRVVGFKTDEPE